MAASSIWNPLWLPFVHNDSDKGLMDPPPTLLAVGGSIVPSGTGWRCGLGAADFAPGAAHECTLAGHDIGCSAIVIHNAHRAPLTGIFHFACAVFVAPSNDVTLFWLILSVLVPSRIMGHWATSFSLLLTGPAETKLISVAAAPCKNRPLEAVYHISNRWH